MRPESYLVNTARGAAVDEEALAEALSTGRLAGAAIDVLLKEPPNPAHPLQNAPNALLTPHVAGLSDRAATSSRGDRSRQGYSRRAAGPAPVQPVNRNSSAATAMMTRPSQ